MALRKKSAKRVRSKSKVKRVTRKHVKRSAKKVARKAGGKIVLRVTRSAERKQKAISVALPSGPRGDGDGEED